MVERRLIALLFLVAILPTACGGIHDYKLEETETRTWPAAGITEIYASTENGNVTVTGVHDTVITADITRRCWGRDKADAEAHIDNVVVEDTVDGGTLTITADMPDNGRDYGADFDISTPDSLYLTAFTSNGDISLSGMVAGADLSTTNGDVSLSQTKGEMDLLTTNGEVTLDAHEGGVNAESSNGNIDCDLAELGAAESAILKTTNGDVVLSLPADVSASFDASTTNGQVTVTGFDQVNYTVNETSHKTGEIGGGDSTITISTTNGDVTIQVR